MKTVTRLQILDRCCDEYEQQLSKTTSVADSSTRLEDHFKRLTRLSPKLPPELVSEIKVELLTLEIIHRNGTGVSVEAACEAIRVENKGVELVEELDLAKRSIESRSSNDLYDQKRRLNHRLADALGGVFPIEENLDFSPRDEEAPGYSRLGRFEIKRRIGAGGFGVVYQGFDPVMDRDVAIKIPRLSLLGDEQARKFLEDETNTLARLNHPGIVTAFHAEEANGYFYLVSEFVDGCNLQEWLDQRTENLTSQDAIRIALQICEALEHAHSLGVIHRDLKPSNVLVYMEDEKPRIKVADFGLAKIVQGKDQRTTTFPAAGTLAYISPERLKNRSSATYSCDIYSVGVILFRFLAGRLPFETENDVELLAQIVERQAPELMVINKSVGRDLSAIVSKCLRKSADDRYATVSELKQDLLCSLNDQPVKAQPLGWRGRLAHWASAKRRISDAAIYSIVLNVALVLWSLAFVPFYYGLELLDPDNEPKISELVFASATLITLCCLPMFWVSINVLLGRFGNLIPAFVLAVVNLVVMFLFLTETVEMDFGGLYENRNTRMTSFSLLIILMSYQSFAFGVAIYCYRRQTSRMISETV